MQIAFRHWVFVLVALASAVSLRPAAAQQPAPKAAQTQVQKTAQPQPQPQQQESSGPSDRLVRVMMSLAWDRMPAKIDTGNGAVAIDKSDPKKFLIPMDDARRVIVAAYRTSSATLCGMNEAVSANFIALMNSEEARKKWTREQLHMIKWIHNAVVILRSANLEESEVSKSQAAKEKAAPLKPEAGVATELTEPQKEARKKGLCSAENKAKLQKEIERYVAQVNAQIGKKVDKAAR